MAKDNALRVAVAGLGAVGLPVAELLLRGGIPGMRLTAVSASSESSAASKLAGLGGDKTDVLCLPASQLAAHADVILEGLPPSAFLEVAESTLSQGEKKCTMHDTKAHPISPAPAQYLAISRCLLYFLP